MNEYIQRMVLPKELQEVLAKGMQTIVPESREELLELAMGGKLCNEFEVAYDVPNKGRVVEVTVSRNKNGAVVNYHDPYMRRRDPDCMLIADQGATDKPRFSDRYNTDFSALRQETFAWLSTVDLIVMPFSTGLEGKEIPALLVAPSNAGFFAGGLGDLQKFIPAEQIPENYKPKAIIYLAPIFRHTHFNGKQMVVHNRLDTLYEMFAYNLYPGPSAKKGVYGLLLTTGEKEGWVTAHGSTVRVITPYDNIITIMHEGASGGGKSEMIEKIHRELDGKILLCTHTRTQEKSYLGLKDPCELRPVTDDMALCHPDIQNDSGKLVVCDAEQGWFLRTNHITKYGTDPYLEELCVHPQEPLIFLNYETVPLSTCLIWEHIMDEPQKPCPNPRVIMPRRLVPNIVDEPVEVDIRSFGVRTPPCSKEQPTYGIIGLFHMLSPALAWLWRLVAPRGHDNPSITDSEGMSSEGVGSYWPFATGRMVDQANLMLKQIVDSPNTRYILVPNQHIGIYKVGFMPQWIAREYLSRRGSAKFQPHQLRPSRNPLLGYFPESLKVDGEYIPKDLLEVNRQVEVGNDGYDAGSKILSDFFKKELEKFLTPDLDPLGKRIIQTCLHDGTLQEYLDLIPMKI